MSNPLNDSDYVPLTASALARRWTETNQYPLSAPVLATIHPLTPQKAALLHLEAAARCAEGSGGASRLMPTDGNPSVVRTWLEDLGVGPSEELVLSWDSSNAVSTVWQTFVDHWDAFCYPAADDITIWAPTCDWVLCYQHYEQFELRFGSAAA